MVNNLGIIENNTRIMQKISEYYIHTTPQTIKIGISKDL